MDELSIARIASGPGVLLGVALYGWVRHKTYAPVDLLGIALTILLLNFIISKLVH